jgi:hypothetical protein
VTRRFFKSIRSTVAPEMHGFIVPRSRFIPLGESRSTDPRAGHTAVPTLPAQAAVERHAPLPSGARTMSKVEAESGRTPSGRAGASLPSRPTSRRWKRSGWFSRAPVDECQAPIDSGSATGTAPTSRFDAETGLPPGAPARQSDIHCRSPKPEAGFACQPPSRPHSTSSRRKSFQATGGHKMRRTQDSAGSRAIRKDS